MSSSSSSSSITSPHPTANHLPESPVGNWYPYQNAAHFDANLAMILVLLLCALLLALAINALIRCFLRLSRRHDRSSHLPETSTGKLKSPGPTVLPSMIYSRGLKLAGAGAECAICLSEFVNGEEIRVLPRCQHGFHVKCIQHWLAAHSSCPTCRASCLSNSLEKNPGSETMVVAGENSPETVSSRV